MSDCHVFVDEGMTNPKSKYHSRENKENENNMRSLSYTVCQTVFRYKQGFKW